MSSISKYLKYLGLGIIGTTGAIAASRFAIKQATRYVGTQLMNDDYEHNLLEFYSAAKRVGLQTIAETNLRAEFGKTIERPLGSPRQLTHFDDLMFRTAVLSKAPTPITCEVDTTTVIGKRCKRPMTLSMPIIVSGMAAGLGLSKQAKYALAKGAAIAGTASNTGEGPVLPFERRLAKNLIIQYGRGTWSKDPAVFQQADMIEIHLGQGASASIGYIIDSKFIDEELRKMLELQPGERAIVESTDPKRFRRLVPYLKEISDGIPIGCKFGFSDHLEEDIDIALEAGVDILALEGSQAATKGAPPILSDDFGLPTIIGLTRAVKHLKLRGMKDKVDLIVSGGLFTPGHFLKAIALGADAVYIGSIALFAMTHKQVFKSLPWEPPTQVVWYSGKHKNRFNWSEGAKALSRFLIACNEEIKEGIMALGKTSIKEVDRNDLVAIDPKAAKICDLPLAYEDIPIRNRTPLKDLE